MHYRANLFCLKAALSFFIIIYIEKRVRIQINLIQINTIKEHVVSNCATITLTWQICALCYLILYELKEGNVFI